MDFCSRPGIFGLDWARCRVLFTQRVYTHTHTHTHTHKYSVDVYRHCRRCRMPAVAAWLQLEYGFVTGFLPKAFDHGS